MMNATTRRPASADVVSIRVPVPLALTQGTLALDLEPLRRAPSRPQRSAVTEPATSPDAIGAWAERYAQAAVEIVGGDRPASQLVRWTSPAVFGDLERRARLVAQAGAHQPGSGRVMALRPRVHSVRSCEVRPGVVEAGVHIRYGQRSRAVAARFERRRERWVCTALEFA